MSYSFHCGWLTFVLIYSLIFSVAEPCLAQSTVVQLPGDARSDIGSTVSQWQAPNSMTARVRHTESMLNSPTPDSWRSEMPVHKLIGMMNQSGFSVVLHASANDNSLGGNSPIRLALHNASIDVNFRFALKAYDCDYQITDTGVIQIFSEDGIEENLSRFTYNVRQLASNWEDVEALSDLLQESIDPDSWEDYGGHGQITWYGTSNGFLMTVVTSWSNHREIRQQLATMLQMGGGSAGNTYPPLVANGVSESVKLPEEYLALRRNRRGMSLPGSGTTSGFGGGGRGGGGIF